jgi:hypothetical protein
VKRLALTGLPRILTRANSASCNRDEMRERIGACRARAISSWIATST